MIISKGIRIAVHILALTLALAAGANASNRAFIWDSTAGMRDVPVHANIYAYDAFSYAEAINNLGEVTGWGPYAWAWNSHTGEIRIIQGMTFPADINDRGEVVGYYYANGRLYGCLSGPTGVTPLGTLPGDIWATPSAINKNSQVVGYSYDGVQDRPFIWDAVNGMRPLVLPEGFVQGDAYGINDTGVVVGTVYQSGGMEVAALWSSPTSVRILGTTGDGDGSEALDINSSGQAVGRARTAGGDWRAFIWESIGGMHELGTLPGCYSSCATAINDVGQVAGNCDGIGFSRAFIWDSANGMRDLGDLGGGSSDAFDINNSGQVCGYSSWQKYLACSIGEAKRLPYYACVQIDDAVVVGEKPGEGVFIESANRIAGMLLVGMGPRPVGQRLSIRGVISGSTMSMYEIVSAVDGEPLAPIGVTSLSMRPEPVGPEAPRSLDLTGILIKLAGRVTAVDTEQRIVCLDDGGTPRLEGAPARGIKVYFPEGMDLPLEQSYAAVTGVGMRESASLAEQMKIGRRIYPPGTLVTATSIVCQGAAGRASTDTFTRTHQVSGSVCGFAEPPR